jgi:hypothetical protein
MNRDEAVDLIKECLTPLTEEQKQKSWGDSYDKSINVRNSFETENVSDYRLNMDSVQVLDTFSVEDGDSGDWRVDKIVVFSYDLGFGIAQYIRTSDYTFCQEAFTLDFTESHNWDLFDSLCFTNDLRDKMKNIIAEMKLLT